MRALKTAATGHNAKEIAGWTQASLFTVGTSLRSAGSSLYSGLKTGYDQLTLDSKEAEKVVYLKFGRLEHCTPQGTEVSLPILLLGYELGFQIWLLQDAVKEIVSRRDHRIRCMDAVPLPHESIRQRCGFLEDWPLLAVVVDAQGVTESLSGADVGRQHCQDLPVSQIKLYSLKRHAYIHTIAIPGKVLSVTCNRRVLILAMSAQIMAYDIATLTVSYSAITQPAPTLQQSGDQEVGGVPLALGGRWLAHASNQAVQSASGIAVGQRVSSSSRPSPAGSNMEAMQHYAGIAAQTSGRHIRSLGEASYKYLSAQVDNWRRSNSNAPSSPSSSATAAPDDTGVIGTVIVRDLVDRSTVTHFRAHTSPLLLLHFDASGALLVTASIHGHTLNIYHIAAPARKGDLGMATHLFRLYRGVTPAVIHGVAFSCCGQWLSVSSGRGTAHVFRLTLSAKSENIPPHLAAASLKDAERREWKPIKLSAIGRARAAASLGSLPGSAAASAAVSLYSGAQGTSLISSTFLPRADASEDSPKGRATESQMDQDLLVILQNGSLTRYSCTLPQAQQTNKPASELGGPPSPREPQNGKQGQCCPPELIVQLSEQYEVCRRRSWPEREEFEGAVEGLWEDADPVQKPWSSYAETSLPNPTVQPLWADKQFHILEMQTGSHSGEDSKEKRQAVESGAVLQVEELPTRRISLQGRSGLAPVIIEGSETAVLRGGTLHPSQAYPSTGQQS